MSEVASSIDLIGYDKYHFMMIVLPQLTRAKVVVETGLGGGASANIWLRSLSMMPDPETRILYTFERDPQEIVVKEIQDKGYKARWQLHVIDDRNPEAALLLPEGTKIDVLYLDAGHDRHEVDAELRNFGPMLSETGVLLTDDAYIIGQSTHNSVPYPQGYTGPTDTYEALKSWADSHGWKTLLFSTPPGMTLCYRY